ncbi:MAG: histidine kinase [Tannerellaceae bacterium]|nr:histidine kinase [Tannerellaceae bacterium]
MDLIGKYTSFRLLLIGLAGGIFIVYPNISSLSWELSFLDASEYPEHLAFFFFRYIYFVILIWILAKYNLEKMQGYLLGKRVAQTFFMAAGAYVLYSFISFFSCKRADCFGSVLIFQFFVVFIVCTFVGHVFQMYHVQVKKEQEIERLRMENLQSRYDALTNQINPHFLFNSLNGLSALIRKKNDENTMAYVNKMSDVFRYILQSEKRGLVVLDEELAFVESFRYMMEVRFANKLAFHIDVKECYLNLKLPVLSLLPLIDNIVVHNTIDSEHVMKVDICMNEDRELVVCNPVYPKLTCSVTNGTGIRNLENRFLLLMNRKIRIENDGDVFRVYLPLI